MKNHLNSWREKFVHALFRHTCTLIACRNGEVPCKTLIACRVKVIGKNDFTLTKTVTILFVHERGNSVHASRGYAARGVPEFPRSWTNNIVTITDLSLTKSHQNWNIPILSPHYALMTQKTVILNQTFMTRINWMMILPILVMFLLRLTEHFSLFNVHIQIVCEFLPLFQSYVSLVLIIWKKNVHGNFKRFCFLMIQKFLPGNLRNLKPPNSLSIRLSNSFFSSLSLSLSLWFFWLRKYLEYITVTE